MLIIRRSKLYYTASGIITLCRWLSSAPDGHLQSVMIPDAWEHESEGVVTGRRYILLSEWLFVSQRTALHGVTTYVCVCVGVCVCVCVCGALKLVITILITSVLQPNAHCILATYIFYQISLTCFSVVYTILRESFVYLLKAVSFVQGCYTRCVIKYKICHSL